VPVNLTDAQRRFLEAPSHYATVATIDPDGMPLQVVVWYLVRGDTLVINSRVGRRWPTNLLRDPRISICVEAALDYVAVRGTVTPIRVPEVTQADIAEMARRYDDPDEAGREIAEFRKQERISFIVHPEKVLSHGDLEVAGG
jgi:PPOX class probable F420-dependent enzyme